ncbi:response regulator transcription factor [Methylohalobius crimeensis]|uniref:response regulator transcription factor n=1 Tax=Methylohalobius crimeensis TaxID=244365 RepID=UPI0003B73920|nr:response regulator [Methylohalobius crimeensis]
MRPIVYIVDDDADLRSALRQLLESVGFQVKTYPDGSSFLKACGEGCAGCVVLDMAMPDMNGYEVQAALQKHGMRLPIIFLTGFGDIPMAVKSIQAGAVDFLEKPVDTAELLERVRQALAIDEERRQTEARACDIRQRYARLSPRECEVMDLVLSGLSNKEIARKLDLSPRTVEVHRTHVMHKMGAANLAELVSMAAHCTS